MARIEPRGQGLGRIRNLLALSLLSLLILSLTQLSGQSQPSGNDVSYTRNPTFRIPFEVEQGGRPLRQVQLYYSLDQGRSWNPGSVTLPEQRGFTFRAERDGLYWFAVQTTDLGGNVNPPRIQGVAPGLKVYVDTQPATIFVRPLAGREGQVGVEWEVRDNTLDLRTLRLDYRQAGGSNWVPLTLEAIPSGQRFWNVPGHVTCEVRLAILDAAGNPREATTTVNASGDPRSPSQVTDHQVRPPRDTAKIVGSKQISLNYKIDQVPKSGIASVWLWFTKDGRNWQQGREDKAATPPFTFEVADEGLYGFTLIVRSGAGLGDALPQVGDPPQVWVEVDITKPVVELFPVEVGRGPDLGKVTITWKATDKNLLEQPISLSYSATADGTWTPIVTKHENTRRYVWSVPAEAPPKLFIKLEAVDKAGNVGTAQTTKEVIVDTVHPKGIILGVDPVNSK